MSATKRPKRVYSVWAQVLAERDGGYKCHYCGRSIAPPLCATDQWKRADDAVPGSVDHKVPLSRGGIRQKANLVLACLACNGAKGNMTETEYRAALAATAPKEG